MKNLIVIIGTCVVLFIGCVLVLALSELGEVQSEVSVIKMLPPDWNPYQRLYDELLKPTVRINTKDGIGSGVVISTTDSTDYILTAAHVVENYSSVSVTFYSYNQPDKSGNYSSCLIYKADVVMTDTNKDLALIRINPPVSPFTKGGLRGIYSAKLAPRNYTPFIFTPVWTVGCSLGLPPRPSSGHICAIRGFYWEVSSPILPGNSGGPVYAKRSGVPTNVGNAYEYEVIGIAVWVYTYQGQLITTMVGVVPISEIYEFLNGVQEFNSSRVQK